MPEITETILPVELKAFKEWQEYKQKNDEKFTNLVKEIKEGKKKGTDEEINQYIHKYFEESKKDKYLHQYNKFQQYVLEIKLKLFNAGLYTKDSTTCTIVCKKKTDTKDAPDPYYNPRIGGPKTFGTWEVSKYDVQISLTCISMIEYRQIKTLLNSIKQTLSDPPKERIPLEYNREMTVQFNIFEPMYKEWQIL